ncbi:TetR/AcrR family transcriptional regulator [Antricoccus suffuscus]|uniref:TetR/AcrR family transcriptional regulator n=1 Tax=Antricoccus suffuscus TaxID=1629062 RepID=UPI001473525A|nr:TetR/AcrR family transcriptional regulator [Antricoccus suffuscus]
MTTPDLRQRSAPTSRSEERRREVQAAAARLIRRRGFDGVGIDDIGAEIGVSGPAVYRYFPSKQAILTRIITDFRSAVAAGATSMSPYAALAGAVFDDPDSAVVALRQLRSLDDPASIPILTGDVRTLMDTLAASPDIDTRLSSEALRVRGAMGALVHTGLARAGTQAARARIARAITPVLGSVVLGPPDHTLLKPDPEVMTHATRREAILAAALRLFRVRSFHGVSLRDIGAEVGITASAVSRHFDSKESLLAVMYDRAAAQIAGGVATALRRSSNAEEAVVELVRRYVDMAIDYRDLIAIYSTEMHFLAAEYLDLRRRNQRMYIDELAHVVRIAQSQMSQAEARIRAGASFAVVNEVIMHDGLVRRRNLPQELATLALCVVREPTAG